VAKFLGLFSQGKVWYVSEIVRRLLPS
jgi:hypothetical protein